MISGTITDRSGRTLSGQTAEAFWISVAHARPLSIGLNCALGPDLLRQYVQDLARIAERVVSAHPNAGLPNALGGYDLDAETMAAEIGEWARVRTGEHRRWLLRNDAGAHRGDRSCSPGREAACRRGRAEG